MLISGLYGMVDPTFGAVDAQFQLLVEEGVRPVQVRCKGWGRSEVRALILRWQEKCEIIVNDDAELAAELGLAVHLGHDDGHAIGAFGRSTHNAAQVRAAGSAAYLGFGPVFPSTSKAGPWPPVGIVGLAEGVASTALPIVAIGGINEGNIESVRATGVAGWAVLAGIWRSPDPRNAIRTLRK